MPDSAMVNEQETLILQTLEQFLERDVRPHVMELEHNDIWPEEIVHKWLSSASSARLSTRNMAALLALFDLRENLRKSRPHLDVACRYFQLAPHYVGSRTAYGTDAQKKKWLPKFAMGELRGGIALTEPNCGTDLQSHSYPRRERWQ